MTLDDLQKMSDDDFLKVVDIPKEETTTEKADPIQEPEPVQVDPVEPASNEPATMGEPAQADPVVVETHPTEENQSGDPSSIGSSTAETAPTKTVTESVVDYEADFKAIMAPFKANGKTVEPRTKEEAIQLMQMGANFTRKMQELAPHRKVLMMLEKNGLLDEGKLSYLIDLEKQNPDAVKKLVKDSGIDPMDIDTTAEANYREGNHRVSDEEANFRTTLDELSSNPAGQETLNQIHTGWDQASKEVLWKQPEILNMIHQQRENGIYNRIVTEMDRQRVLGIIPANTPFLSAYKAVGDNLVQANAFSDLIGKPAATVVTKVPVATRAAVPKPQVTNNAAAIAAAATRSSPGKAATVSDTFKLSDDEFLKLMANRL